MSPSNILDTKSKGDIGLTKIIADLTEKGIGVALPIAEHFPYDLIAISKEHKLRRISVKYVTLIKGSVSLPLRSICSNMKGYKVKRVDLDKIDGFGIYCPTNNACYYVPTNILTEYETAFALRVDERGIRKYSHKSTDFIDCNVLFARMPDKCEDPAATRLGTV
mgnify:CR=1 FL=1